jgi:hypothetical protein
VQLDYNFNEFTDASERALEARRSLIRRAQQNLEFTDSFFRLAPNFVHAGMFARQLAVFQLVNATSAHPGVILDFGTYTGFFACMAEISRAVVSSHDHKKVIAAFDTFEGYSGFEGRESRAHTVFEGSYSTGTGYESELRGLLADLEMSHGKKNPVHQVVRGNASVTFPKWAKALPLASVSLVSFDMNAKKPTRDTLIELMPYLSEGSQVVFWQFNRGEITGEREAYFELKSQLPKHRLIQSPVYPSLVSAQFL